MVNPYDDERMAEAVDRALTMPEAERIARMKPLNARVMRRTVFRWAKEFVSELTTAGAQEEQPSPQQLSPDKLTAAYHEARSRLILLDYDGTLVRFVNRPERAVPPNALLDVIRQLAADPANAVALISGRRADQLTAWFGSIEGLLLAAEHGAKIRPSGPEGWRTLREAPSVSEWKEKVRPILDHFVDRTPGSFVEEKEFSLAWHYRTVEPDFGEWLAGELATILAGMLSDTDARAVRGHKVIEVRPTWANKGEMTSWMLTQRPDASFFLAAGDDRTDEDMFAQMPPGSWTIYVGGGPSRASYRVSNPECLLQLLSRVSATDASKHEPETVNH
jgi:trehalose 6-phosphate synthase/phosphatase